MTSILPDDLKSFLLLQVDRRRHGGRVQHGRADPARPRRPLLVRMEQLTVFQERDVHQPRVRRVEDRPVLGELSSVRNEKKIQLLLSRFEMGNGPNYGGCVLDTDREV